MHKYFLGYIKGNLGYLAPMLIYLCIFWVCEFMPLAFTNHAREGPRQNVPLAEMLQPHLKSCKGEEHQSREGRQGMQPESGWTEAPGTNPGPICEALNSNKKCSTSSSARCRNRLENIRCSVKLLSLRGL